MANRRRPDPAIAEAYRIEDEALRASYIFPRIGARSASKGILARAAASIHFIKLPNIHHGRGQSELRGHSGPY